MSNGKGIAIAGLILGLIGAGLGGYVFFDNTIAPMIGFGDSSSNTTTYFKEDDVIVPTATSSNVLLTNMTFKFTTTQPVQLYVLFTSYVRITTSSGDEVYIYLYLDGTSMTPTYYYIDALGYASQERYPVNMQGFKNSLPAGTYNVSVFINVDHLSSWFFCTALTVQLTT